MKLMFTVLVLAVGSFAQAQIAKSSFSAVQSAEIQAAIVNSCGYVRNLSEVSNTQSVVVVDQGVHDIYNTTVLVGERRLDQNVFDALTITVKSSVVDAYDHQNQTWGVFVIESVSCN